MALTYDKLKAYTLTYNISSIPVLHCFKVGLVIPVLNFESFYPFFTVCRSALGNNTSQQSRCVKINLYPLQHMVLKTKNNKKKDLGRQKNCTAARYKLLLGQSNSTAILFQFFIEIVLRL